MCGIAGFLELTRRPGTQELEAVAHAMAATLSHRGPDASGVFVDAEAGLGFGHTRLAIVDLSPAGAQPMISASGRYVVTYNGEIYSGAELRPELEALGCRFRGHSDTEVIIEAVDAWGVEATLKRLIGMFAFAVWDRKQRRLSLARDRLGIKPLYYGRQNGRVAFASELKAFAALPGWRGELNQDALASYLRLTYVPSPHSIYQASTSSRLGTSPPSMPAAPSRRAPIGVSPMLRATDTPRRSSLAMKKRPMLSRRCCRMRSSGGWSRTCRSARSSPAASILRPSRQ